MLAHLSQLQDYTFKKGSKKINFCSNFTGTIFFCIARSDFLCTVSFLTARLDLHIHTPKQIPRQTARQDLILRL